MLKTEKSVICALLILVSSMTISGCSVKKNVNFDSVNEFKKELMEVSDIIRNVNVSFTRPSLTYEVNMKGEPTQEVINAVFSKAKLFTTVENMDKIAHKVGWQGHISNVYLKINTDDDDTVEYEYFTRYYKTAKVEDIQDNIDAYQTWKQAEL